MSNAAEGCLRCRADEPCFPPLLRELPDGPEKLYVRGAVETLTMASHRYLVVVGSREYTPYGKAVCEELIAGLAGYPVVIVSGLALGIDGVAHKSALAAGLTTIAVPGSGLSEQVLYPATHRRLARDIIEAGGALVSEFEPLFKPRPESFPQRNRIMAGMSHAVLVVEAKERSGTLITARLAAEYNRDVLAVPGPIHAPSAAGPHLLLKRGAALITGVGDILEALALDPHEKAPATNPQAYSTDERAVLDLLAHEPLTRDELNVRLGQDASRTNALLVAMELKGLVIERLGKFGKL